MGSHLMAGSRKIAFDLEGPLSPNDHAYELMGLRPYGAKVFEVLSRYDDLLALEGRGDYEPGDTLRLIVPFLIYYGIGEDDIRRLAERASLTPGAKELIERLKDKGWQVLCLTTTYQQYALRIADRLGIPEENVASTPLPLEKLRERIGVLGLRDLEEELLGLEPVRDDERIKERLDRFYYEELPPSVIEVLSLVKPVGGRRKVEALRRLVGDFPLSNVVAVGDSITDRNLLDEVRRAGGLAVAFNANQYALPYANVGFSGESLMGLEPIILSWADEGEEGVRKLALHYSGPGHIHLIGEGEMPLEVHLKYRRLLRQRAAELG